MLAFVPLLLLQTPLSLDGRKAERAPKLPIVPPFTAARSMVPEAIRAMMGADTESVVSFSPATGLAVAGRGYLAYDGASFVQPWGGRFEVKPGLANAPSALIVLQGLVKGSTYLVVLNTYGVGARTEVFLQEPEHPEVARPMSAEIPQSYGNVPLTFKAAGPDCTLVAFMESRGAHPEPSVVLSSVDVRRVK